jgi:hypothetical protein
MRAAWVALVVAGLLGCKDKPQNAPGSGGAGAATAGLADEVPVTITGPSVAPVITNSVTFFVPRDAPWWGEVAFACYAAAITLQPGSRPSQAFTQISPAVEPALRIADIDLDKDVSALGAWGCGEGACMYMALDLRSPDKLRDMLAQFVPGQQPKDLGPHHWSIDAPGAHGPRVIQLRAVPIAWPAKVPTHGWSRDAARATHILFLTGLFDETSQVDGLAAGADSKVANARVIEIESIVGDPRGRCLLGYVNERLFQPGYQLERARFILAAPEDKGDPLTQLFGSRRTLDLEVELLLDPPPSAATVQSWIVAAGAWVSNIADSVHAGFSGQGPIVEAVFDIGALLGKRSFRHTLKDKSLTLSFRSDRIASAELVTIESRLQTAMKAQPERLTPPTVTPEPE